MPKTDISTTRVAGRFNMIHSVLLLNKALKAFVRVYDGDDLTWTLTDENWEALAEMEAVVKVITDVTTRVQAENSQMGAMGHLIHLRLLEQLRGSELLVLDLDNISKTVQPRKPRLVTEFSAAGRMCLKRAQLEAERRLCGSTAMQVTGITGAPPIRSDRETMCLLLDPRTHHLHCTKKWQRPELVRAQNLLGALYVEYFLEQDRRTADLTISPSDSDDDDGLDLCLDMHDVAEPRQRLTMEEWEEKHRRVLKDRFRKELRAYSRALSDVDWHNYASEHGIMGVPQEAASVDPFVHLMNVNALPLLKTLAKSHERLVLLATHSRASIASLPAASFAERINSAAGIVSNKSNYCLNAAEIGCLVPLRVNKLFYGDLLLKVAANVLPAPARVVEDNDQ